MLQAGRSRDQIPVWERFSAPVQTGPGTYPASYTMGKQVFPRGKAARGMALTNHLHLALKLKKE
jgi:hypothetical protein